MQWLRDRTTLVGVSMLALASVLGATELVVGERTWADIALISLLLGVTSAGFALLRKVTGSLDASVTAREELRVRLGQQQAVARLGQRALTEAPLQELFDEACRRVAAELDADVAGILQLLPGGDGFVQRAGAGWPRDELGVEQVPAGPRSQAGYTLAARTSVIMRDAAHEKRFELSPQMVKQGITSGVSTSIGSNGETWGVIGAHTQALRVFSADDVTFLEAVATVLAGALARHAAVEEADQTHRVFEAVIEGTTDHVFVNDIEGRFITLNEASARTLGKPREEIIGHTVQEVIHGPVGEALDETDRIVLERGTVETFEESVVINHEPHVLLTTKGPYRSRDGTLLGTFGIARDITARKASEQELARSEERLRLAQEGARMGTWDLDVRSGVTTYSDGLRRMYGIPPEHPAGLEHFAKLLHPDDREWVTRLVRKAYAAGTDFEFESRLIRPDGGLRWIMARTTCVRDEDETPVRILGVVADITERKLAEEELVRSEETLRLAQQAVRLGSWDWNMATQELRWSPAVYEIFALDPESYKPTWETMAGYIHPEDREMVSDTVARVVGAGESYFDYPCRIVRPSGTVRWVLNRGSIVRDADGNPTRILGVVLDETERRSIEAERAQLERRLRQAETMEAVGRLAGGIAHDFNNLLVAIRGYGELALGRLAHGVDGVAEDITAVIQAADRAAALTKQLLAFGRRQVLDPEALDLNDVVRETTGLLRRVIGDNVELVTKLAEHPVVVKADRGQLEQVITNLAVNGRHAMTGGGVLTIRVETAELPGAKEHGAPHYALLSVTDEGTGIDAENAPHVFEPFFTTKGDGGTGLGLATVHGIVAQSGGQIVLETELDRGSTFRVYLPLSSEALADADEAAPAGAKGTETILLVEDDPTVRSIVAMMLAERGYEIVEASGGEEAISLFESGAHSVQLVLSDLAMRGLDGRQTVDRIRTLAPGTKALYMSGYTDDAIIRSGGLGPGTSFIQKPFSGDELAARVRELLNGPPAGGRTHLTAA